MAAKELKVVKVLKELDDSELDRLALFLDAEYFVSEDTCQKYFRALRTALAAGTDPLDQEALFHEVFPQLKFSYNKFSRLNAQLLQWVYRFLSIEYLGGKDLLHWGLVVEALEEKSRFHLLELTLPSWERSLDRAPDSLEKIRQTYRLLEINASKPEGYGRQTRIPSRSRVIQALDEYHHLAKLRLECSMLNRELVLGEVSENEQEESPTEGMGAGLIELYDLVRANLSQPDDPEILLRLEASLVPRLQEVKAQDFSVELKEICTYALNGAIRLRNLRPGEQSAQDAVIRMYKLLLDQGILTTSGRLSPWHFKNIIQFLTLSGAFGEAAEVIETYGGILDDDYKQNAVVYAQGYLAFHQGKISEALRAIHQLLGDYKDVYYGLDGRTLMLRCHFELGDPAALEFQSEAYRQFLLRLGRRNSVSKAYRQLYGDFLKNISTLGKIVFGPPDKKKTRLQKFRLRLQGAPNVLHRKWLMEKVSTD